MSSPFKTPHPPLFADRFLKWFCSEEVLETLQGDLYELYEKRRERTGKLLADIYYAFDVLSALRPFAFEKKRSNSNYTTMLQHYLTISWRNLRVNRLYSLLNISGLAVGLACGILILLWISHEASYEKFNENLANIYLMKKNQTLSGDVYTGSTTPAPLAHTLRAEVPEVTRVARTTGAGQEILNAGKEGIYVNCIYADPDLFDIMTFPAILGKPSEALENLGAIVITESTAKRLFGTEDPIGKMLRHNNTHSFQVAAVIKDIPSSSTLRFEAAMPFSLYEQERAPKWDNNSFLTWMELPEDIDLAAFNSKVENIVTEHLENEEMGLFAFPLAREHLHSRFKNGQEDGGKIDFLYMLGALGVFILLLACINFMNLATARSSRRAREVGVRKVMGAQRGSIVGQFLSEALMITFLGLVLGVLITKLALPSFNLLIQKDLIFDFSNWKLWSGLLVLGVATGLVAGSYPAVFLSRFQPVKVIRGISSSGKGAAIFRKGLVIFQFFVSVFLIISTIVVYQQIQYTENRPLGYEQENLIEIPAQGDLSQQFDVVKNDLLQIPGVKSVSTGSDNLLRMGGGITGFKWPGKDPEQDFPITLTWVGYDWAKTAGLTMVEGREFSPEFGGDSLACIINQTAARRMGLEEPVGTLVGDNNHIIGVVEDFVYNDPTSDTRPMIIYLGKNLGHFFVRFQNDENWQQRLATIEEVVGGHNPGYPLDIHFTKEEYQRSFNQARSVGEMITIFSGLAIFIASLGLVGLSAFVAEQRKKEIGVRKILGATVRSIGLSLSVDFLKPVAISFVLAAPLAAWVMEKALDNLDYHIELSWWIFAAAGTIAVIIALLTVSYHAIRAALANPVDSIRTE
jgi:putative ABC transport system permease protein